MPAAVRSVACVWAAFAALAVLLSHVAESAAAPPPREMVVPPTRVVGGSSTGMLAAAGASVCLIGHGIPPLWTSTTAVCELGYYCPHTNSSDPATFPQICPPTAACQSKRMFGKFCAAQGMYEPTVCKAGWYCPPGGLQQLPCPAGHYCPLGSWSPLPCGAFTSCPAGSSRRLLYAPVLAVVLLDMVICAVVVVSARRRKHAERVARAAIDEVHKRRAVERSHASESTLSSTQRLLPCSEAQGYSAIAAADDTSVSGLHARRLITGIQEANGQAVAHPRSSSRNDGGVDTTPRLRLHVEFRKLDYHLPSGRQILHGLSGQLRPGRLTAIMGPSGAGKTALLHCIMGKTQATGGRVSVNGAAVDVSQYRSVIGFVPQDDVLHTSLTAREIISYAARCRLPRSWSADKVNVFTDTVLNVLGLAHVEGVVGDDINRGMSGGERKRVNIGVELAAAPLLLCLDEPTSGLDAAAALSCATMLKRITGLGITCCAVIHQPRQEIFDQLDDVILLASGGHQLYSGPAQDLIPAMRAQGYDPTNVANPADWLLDVAVGNVPRTLPVVPFTRLDAPDTEDATLAPHGSMATGARLGESRPPSVCARGARALGCPCVRTRGSRRTPSVMLQAWLACRRSLLVQRREISSLVVEVFLTGVSGVLMGLTNAMSPRLYSGVLRVPYSLISPAPDDMSLPLLCFFVNMAIGVAMSPAAVRVFGADIAVYWRETASGHSPLAAFVGKTVAVLPRITLAAAHFAAALYMLAKPRGSFLAYACVSWMIAWCVYALGGIVSVLTARMNSSLIAVIAAMAISSACGFSPTLADVRTWGVWPVWASFPAAHAAECLYGVELLQWQHLFDVQQSSHQIGYALHAYGGNIAAMAVIGVAWRVINYLLLVLVRRNKQR